MNKKLSAWAISLILFVSIIPISVLIVNAALGEGDFDFTVDAGRGSISEISPDYFLITMVADHNGDKVWFGFNVTANAAGKTVEFRCVQAGNLWSDTWCYPVYSDDHGVTWQQCDDISIPNEGEGRVLYFEVSPSADHFMVYAAYPVLYTEYEAWITTINANENCTVTSNTVSGGEEQYLITITENGGDADRPTMWVICGQDPPETWAQNAGRGMVDFLLSADSVAARLRSANIYKIIPVSNPNAVRHGFTTHNTDDAGGEEINTDWTSPSELETIAMKADIAAYVAGGGNIVMMLDMHCAGGAMFPVGSIMYGLNNQPNTTWAQDWADLLMAGTVYDDNPTISPGSQSSERLKGYAQTLGISGATLELFMNQNLFDWGDPVATMSSIRDVGEDIVVSLEDYMALWDAEPPEPPAPSGAKPSYTEMIDSFTIGSAASWTDHNITAGESVPKGVVAEIVMTNTHVEEARLMGVRYDGSGVNRYIDRCPVDTVGGSATRMLVNVSSTGLIECYAEDTVNITFYVTGYWSDTTFTELMYQLPFTGDNDGLDVWTNFDVEALAGIPVNSTIGVIVGNARTDGLRQGGVRTDGSALNRMLDMSGADTEGVNTWDTYVQSGVSTGIIEAQAEFYTHNPIYLTGYFDYNVNFSEAWTTSDISAASWTNLDLTANIYNDTDIVDFSLCNVYTTAVASSHGVREDGSSDVRVVPQGESIDGGPLGFGMSAKTSALGVVELYSSANNELFKYGGFFRVFASEEEAGVSIVASIISGVGVASMGSIMGVPWGVVYSVNNVPT